MRESLTRLGYLPAVALLVLAAAPAAAGVTLPGGTTVEEVDFERHVMGLLGRAGCASGSCHGSFQGKGNFRLSLFGYDPAADHYALTRDAGGRRLDLAAVDRSLLLLKATGQAAHGGQTRFGPSSWQYRLLRAWVAQGAKRTPGSGRVRSVRVTPAECAFGGPGQAGALEVEAAFADGSREDVTALCDFRTNDDGVAEVSGHGVVKALRPGDTAVVVSYRGSVVAVPVLVPVKAPPGFAYPAVPQVNFIDRAVAARLRRLNVVPSGVSGDAEFLRRVTLDTIGTVPAPDEVRAFLADADPKKRERKIDALLAHPMHAALWATRFSDVTGNNTDALENPPQRKAYLSQMWHDWFRKRIADNTPYDEIVKGVLTATSREGASLDDYVRQVEAYEAAQDRGEKTTYADRKTLDLFWRRQARVTPEQWGEKAAAAFLGVRLECAGCHKHPFDRWTQADYRSFANIFQPLNVGAPPRDAQAYRAMNQERGNRSKALQGKARRAGAKGLPVAPLREVFVGPPTLRGALVDPESRKPLPARALGGPEIVRFAGKGGAVGADPRLELWGWMRGPDNPFFARSMVNRVWGHYFGVGIVHPVDDFSLANPPSNGELLDALARDFIRNRFDLRATEKAILMSRTYQLTSEPNETNRHDRAGFARSHVRPLMAEVVVDLLNTALGTGEKWLPGEAPAGARAIEVGASRVQNGNVNYAFRVFGRPPRGTACDCERASEPALPQKLFLIADPVLTQKLNQPTNRLGVLLGSGKDDGAVLEELFLATLSRFPTADERKTFLAYRDGKAAPAPAAAPGKPGKGRPAVAAARRAVFVDTLWALINTREFIFNH